MSAVSVDEAVRVAIWQSLMEHGGRVDVSEFNSALRAAGYAVEQGWQPIATAPRDGTPVIGCVYCPTGIDPAHWVVFICWWTDGNPGAFNKPSGWMSDSCEDFGGHEHPTHWRPLPEGPV